MTIKGLIDFHPVKIMRAIACNKLSVKVQSLCLIMGLSLVTLPSFAASFSDHQIKAVFLFNFASFVRWPETSFGVKTSPFVFCASNAHSPTIKTLRKVIEGESVGSHKLVLKAPFKPADLASCHILFLEETDLAHYRELLPRLSSGSLLTVSDTANFVERGGLIQFAQHKTQIQPIINTSQLEQSQLDISSTLLRLAKIYRSPETGVRP